MQASVLVSTMDELNVSSNFDWSASKSGFIRVELENPSRLSLNKEYLELLSSNGEIVKRV
jgi:hypothetical protein